MIPRDFLTEWRVIAPWPSPEQVEQDLVISRAVVEIFRTQELRERLAWRGGTALHKLYLHPAARYSEDIDLVQVGPEPIGSTLDALRRVLDPWLGNPRRVFKEGRVVLVYRFSSEGPPPVPLRLKIEINTREHFSHHGLVAIPYMVDSRWFRLAEKFQDPSFAADVPPLLATGVDWDVHVGTREVLSRLVARVPGDPWKGSLPI